MNNQQYATLPQMNRFTIPFGIGAFGGRESIENVLPSLTY